MKPPTAVVMNMFYTGLGIARSLGEHGIPVVGLSAQRGIYGNFTRYARTVFCPDSRNQPEALRQFLLTLGAELGPGSVLFPTRDDDVVFMDRYRAELERYFILAAPEREAVDICLDKWKTYLLARQAGVPAPRCWMIEREQDVPEILGQITYPVVLKPVISCDWRKGDNWTVVGGRKAIGISSRQELLAEYAAIASADQRVLVQEMIPGRDDCLIITACYLNRESEWVAGFNTQKLVQAPEGFGTGCLVQAADRPELDAPTLRLLREMHFTGIAEVEYKWDAAAKEYKLIEINPRPWDQHRLGKAAGADLVYLAYCDYAGLPVPPVKKRPSTAKWVAEDTFVTNALRMLWRRDPKLRSLFKLARGKRIYAVWSARDPLPSIAYVTCRFLPSLAAAVVRRIFAALLPGKPVKTLSEKKGMV